MIESKMRALRACLEPAFSSETAVAGTRGGTASAGHCAAVAAIVRVLFGGEYVSANVSGMSHWFNRVDADGAAWDVDLTGDQFGRPSVQVAAAGTLYAPNRVRQPGNLHHETLRRAKLLAERAGLKSAAVALGAFAHGERACLASVQ